MALLGSGQLTSLSFLFLSIFTCKRLFGGCCFSDLPRGVLSIGVQGSWFLLSGFGNVFLTRKNITEGPFLASLGDTHPLVHTSLKFHPLHWETERPVFDLICRSIHSPLDSWMHSSIFNLISLFTQTHWGERRMELTGLIISSHLLSPKCQNCISIIPSISILPVVSKGSCWCGEQEPDSGIKLGHGLWPRVLLLNSRFLFRGLQTTQVFSGARVQRTGLSAQPLDNHQRYVDSGDGVLGSLSGEEESPTLLTSGLHVACCQF